MFYKYHFQHPANHFDASFKSTNQRQVTIWVLCSNGPISEGPRMSFPLYRYSHSLVVAFLFFGPERELRLLNQNHFLRYLWFRPTWWNVLVRTQYVTYSFGKINGYQLFIHAPKVCYLCVYIPSRTLWVLFIWDVLIPSFFFYVSVSVLFHFIMTLV